jgi:AraC family transcriptional regulator
MISFILNSASPKVGSMNPVIKPVSEKKLIGKRVLMSLSENKTPLLWRSFLPNRNHIENAISNEMISMSNYSDPLRLGDLHQQFDKWAAVEVSNFDNVPADMETFIVVGGLYAVFHYKGLSTDNSIFIHIFGTWLPNSEYELDNRPHFEILGDKYKNGDPDSEEDIYIPIKPRQ